MEIAHAQRDHMTRDFHNKIDTSRQRDSGLQGMIPKGDPTATAHNDNKGELYQEIRKCFGTIGSWVCPRHLAQHLNDSAPSNDIASPLVFAKLQANIILPSGLLPRPSTSLLGPH